MCHHSIFTQQEWQELIVWPCLCPSRSMEPTGFCIIIWMANWSSNNCVSKSVTKMCQKGWFHMVKRKDISVRKNLSKILLYALNARDSSSIPGFGRSPGVGNSYLTPVFWPEEFHGLYSPWGCKESDTTEQLSLSFPVTSYLKFILKQNIVNSLFSKMRM